MAYHDDTGLRSVSASSGTTATSRIAREELALKVGCCQLASYRHCGDPHALRVTYNIARALGLPALARLRAHTAPLVDGFLVDLHSALLTRFRSTPDPPLDILHRAVAVARWTARLVPLAEDGRLHSLQERAETFEALAELDPCSYGDFDWDVDTDSGLSYPAVDADADVVADSDTKVDPEADLLLEAIALRRRALELLPDSDPKRLGGRRSLASVSWRYWKETGMADLAILDECILLQRETLQSDLPTNDDRATACRSLALSLWDRYKETDEPFPVLEEVVALEREVLRLQPKGHVERAMACANLAVHLNNQFKKGGDMSLLREAIALQTEVLQLRPAEHPQRDASCVELALSLWTHFKHTGDMSSLDEVIKLEREIRELRPVGHLDRTFACRNLAVSLTNHFEKTGDVSLLNEAIQLKREALRLCPPDHARRSSFCASLALSLTTAYEHNGEIALLDEAVVLEREALSLRPVGYEDRARALCNLASSLRMRFKKTGQTALLDEAVSLNKEALQLRPVGHPDRARSCDRLASSLWYQYKVTGDLSLLEQTVRLEREALELRPVSGHLERAGACHDLAVSLRAFFKQAGDPSLLHEALDLDREALRLLPPGHSERASTCIGLAISLTNTFEQTGDTSLLDEAIELEREALQLRPVGHRERATSLGNLASSLSSRFKQTEDLALLNEAIKLHREALQLRPVGHPDHALSCVSLAYCLTKMLTITGDTALLVEAIGLEKEAVQLRPPGHPDRARACENLASSLHRLFDQTGDMNALDEAIQLGREAILQRSAGDYNRAFSYGSLARKLRTRFLRTRDASLLEEAMHLYSDGVDFLPIGHQDRPTLLIGLARIRLERDSPYYDPIGALSLLHSVADDRTGLIAHADQLNGLLQKMVISELSGQGVIQLLNIYRVFIDALPELANAVLDRSARLQRLGQGTGLAIGVLSCAIRTDELAIGLELMEQSRAVLWSQALNISDPQLDGLPGQLATELQMLLQALSAHDRGHDAEEQHARLTSRDLLYRKHDRLQQLLVDVRALPGHERFMRGQSYADLARTASTHPVVVLTANGEGCQAIIIRNKTSPPTHLPLERMRYEDVLELSMQTRSTDMNVRSGQSEAHRGDEYRGLDMPTEAEKALKKVWHRIVKPVLESLGLQKRKGRARPRLHWCPIGALAFLPVHAAGVFTGGMQECCSDYVVSSYTPTLSALRRAQEGLDVKRRDSLAFLVAAVKTSPGMAPLNLVEKEAAQVERIAAVNSNDLIAYGSDTPARVHDVKNALSRTDIVHLACHGVQDRQDPLQSGFCLSDGKLTVSELMNIKLDRAFLAFLSACETAKGDQDQPDQAIHLAAAMLFCGFRSVIGTMWSMHDADGPEVATIFYEALLAHDVLDADIIPYALDEAVCTLRKRKLPSARWAAFVHIGA